MIELIVAGGVAAVVSSGVTTGFAWLFSKQDREFKDNLLQEVKSETDSARATIEKTVKDLDDKVNKISTTGIDAVVKINGRIDEVIKDQGKTLAALKVTVDHLAQTQGSLQTREDADARQRLNEAAVNGLSLKWDAEFARCLQVAQEAHDAVQALTTRKGKSNGKPMAAAA